MILFNSTCMCLQSIGEAIKKTDDITKGELFAHYPEIQWKRVVGLRNILSHEYLSIDPDIILNTVKNELPSLLDAVHCTLTDVEDSKHNSLFLK